MAAAQLSAAGIGTIIKKKGGGDGNIPLKVSDGGSVMIWALLQCEIKMNKAHVLGS